MHNPGRQFISLSNTRLFWSLWSRVHPRWPNLRQPAPAGSLGGGGRKKHEQQNLHSTHSGRSGMQRFQSSYLFAWGKYQKSRWAQGALDSLWVWLQHTDWSKNRQILFNTTSLCEEISSLILGFDSKSPVTNNSTISCALFQLCICPSGFSSRDDF